MLPLLITTLLFTVASAQNDYFATRERQTKDPFAFALTYESLDFHRALARDAFSERNVLIKKIQMKADLHRQIINFAEIDLATQKAVLREVFALQTQNYAQPPLLTLGAGPKGEAAFFEFNPAAPGPGKVYIDFKRLAAKDHPYASLLLLIHETHHSAQFQMGNTQVGPRAHGYFEAFRAQKEIFSQNEKISFGDFMSLLNEYEAFQYANFILNRLTSGKVQIKGMGTNASQYNSDGSIKLNIMQLMLDNPESEWFEIFNQMNKK